MKIHPLPGRGFSSNVFIVEGTPSFIVDAGLDADVHRILSYVRERDLSPGALLLTHRHVDHTGGAARLARELEIPVYSTLEEAAPLTTGDALTTGALLFGCPLEPVEVSDIAEWDSGKWEVVPTPGHTAGSFCLYRRGNGDGILISGDTVFADGGVGRWDLPTGSLNDLISSVRLLSRMNVEKLYPGHGRWLEADAGRHISVSLKSLGDYE